MIPVCATDGRGFMSTSPDTDLLIGPALPNEQAEALALLAAAGAGEPSPDGLFVARRAGRLVGAACALLQPGRTAIIGLPRIDRAESEITAQRLLAGVCDWLSQQDVCLAQALLETPSETDLAVLRKGGFAHLADLLYLVSLNEEFPTSLPVTPLDFEVYGDGNHDRLARIVDATCEQTRDCPQLNGVRHTEDVLAGYRGIGVFDPSRWLIARHQGRDAGCLLLTDHPQHENYELVYMGVAPAARGHGWGTDITRLAQWLARCAGRPRLVLAVDAANEPAIGTYAAAGFQAWDRRSVYVRVFRRAAGGVR